MQNDETQEDVTLKNDVTTETESEESTEETVTDWEAEAKKWKAIAGRKAKKAEEAAQTQTEPSSTNLSSKEVERLTLKVDGYNDEEISEVMKLGGLKALQNPIVKKAIEAMREERQAENAQVTDGGAASEFSRKYSPQDLRKMSTEELEKILPTT